MRTPSTRLRSLLIVTILGALLGACVSVGYVAGQPQPCCGDKKPYSLLLKPPLSRIDAVLAEGDGQAFAAMAQDPLMRRPWVLQDRPDFAYREQRPVWGYLTWAVSLGQAGWTGWVLVLLTVLSCGLATGVTGLLLLDRARSVWWALLVPVLGFESLTELTAELLAFALLGLAVWCWTRSRRGTAVALLSVAALTRETMLFGVVALACWELWQRRDDLRTGVRRASVLVVPFLVYGAWIVVVRLRLGNWPFNRSNDRLGLPGVGLVEGLARAHAPTVVLLWSALGAFLVAGAIVVARHDPLTWISVAFFGLATVLGPEVWGATNAGYQRTLIPLFLCGGVALVGGLPVERGEATTGHSPAPVAAR